MMGRRGQLTQQPGGSRAAPFDAEDEDEVMVMMRQQLARKKQSLDALRQQLSAASAASADASAADALIKRQVRGRPATQAWPSPALRCY